MPRILVVYPHNFMLRNSGINSRYYELLRYFTLRGFHVDVLGLKGFVDQWDDTTRIPGDDIRIEELYLYDYQEGLREAAVAGRSIRKIMSGVFSKRPSPSSVKYRAFPDFAFKGMKKYFESIVSGRHYDYILISYAYWAGLIEGGSYPETTLVLEISDFQTLNLYDAENGSVDLGALLTEEVRRVNLFDKVLCINEEELRFFARLARNPEYTYVPHFMALPEIRPEEPDYDLCFVASDNPHNIQGITWFYHEVMPLLPKQLRYLIVGKITGHLPRVLENVTAIPFAEDLGKVYGSSKIAICPLLGGSGMKIKVVEALAHGLPVVCTSYGVAGFQDRQFTGCSVADTPAAFAGFVRKLTEDRDFFEEQRTLAGKYFRNNFSPSHAHEALGRVFG